MTRAEAQRVVVTITPGELSVVVGDTQESRIVLTDRDGMDVPISRYRSKAVSNKPAVSTVQLLDNRLRVTGVSQGLATVTLRVGDLRPRHLIVRVESGEDPGSEASAPASGAAPTRRTATHPRDQAATPVELRPGQKSLRLIPGERDRVKVEAVSASGAVLSGVRLTYSSVEPSLVSVDSSGEITAVAPGGPVAVVVTAPGSLPAAIQVTVETVAVLIQPDSLLIYPSWRDTLRLTLPALQRDLRGPVTWTSSNPGILGIDPATGVLGPIIGTGVVTVTARSPAGETSTVIQVFPQEYQHLFGRDTEKPIVMPLGNTVQLGNGAALDANGDTLFSLPLRWEIGDPTVATFDPVKGVLVALRRDTTTLRATLLIRRREPLVHHWPIRVIGGGVMADRGRVGLRVGQSDSLKLLMLDSLGRPTQEVISGAWSVVQASPVLRLESDGSFEAIGPGRATLTARAPWDSSTTVTVIVAADLYYSFSAKTTDGKPYAELRGVDLKTKTQHPITSEQALDASPAVSPDRTRIAFLRKLPGGPFNVLVADADGENAVNITSDTFAESEPAWSHDGSKLFFIQGNRLFMADPDGGQARLFFASPFPIVSLAVSADGRFIVFSTQREGQYDLYQLPLTTSGPLGIAGIESPRYQSPDNEIEPQFAANGDLFYIKVGRKGEARGRTLMRLKGDAAVPEPITPTTLQVMSFAVAPDGNRILFVGQPTSRDARQQRHALYYIDLNLSPIPELFLPNEPESAPASPAFAP